MKPEQITPERLAQLRIDFPESMSQAEARAKLYAQLVEDDSDTFSPLTYQRIRLHDTKGPDKSMIDALDAFFKFLNDSGRVVAHTTEFLVKKQSNCFSLWRHPAWTNSGGLIVPAERPPDASRRQKGSRGLTSFYALSKVGLYIKQHPDDAVIYGHIRKTRSPDLLWGEWVGDGEMVSLNRARKARLKTNGSSMILDGSVLI